MNKPNHILFVCLSVCLLSLTTCAQEIQLKTSVLSPFINTLNISTQFKANANSVNITASFMAYKKDEDYYQDNIKGLSITSEYRIHLSDEGFRCGFIAPFGRVMYYENHRKIVDKHELGKYTTIGLGFVGGKQYALSPKVTLEWFAGPVVHFSISEERKLNGYNTNTGGGLPSAKLADFISNRYLNGYGFRCGINIGFIL